MKIYKFFIRLGLISILFIMTSVNIFAAPRYLKISDNPDYFLHETKVHSEASCVLGPNDIVMVGKDAVADSTIKWVEDDDGDKVISVFKANTPQSNYEKRMCHFLIGKKNSLKEEFQYLFIENENENENENKNDVVDFVIKTTLNYEGSPDIDAEAFLETINKLAVMSKEEAQSKCASASNESGVLVVESVEITNDRRDMKGENILKSKVTYNCRMPAINISILKQEFVMQKDMKYGLFDMLTKKIYDCSLILTFRDTDHLLLKAKDSWGKFTYIFIKEKLKRDILAINSECGDGNCDFDLDAIDMNNDQINLKGIIENGQVKITEYIHSYSKEVWGVQSLVNRSSVIIHNSKHCIKEK